MRHPYWLLILSYLVQAFATAGIEMETKDISLAARILSISGFK
jgi:monomeric isocitrate dehydrogenase